MNGGYRFCVKIGIDLGVRCENGINSNAIKEGPFVMEFKSFQPLKEHIR